MDLVVMIFRLELGDLILPIRVEDVAILSREALRDLLMVRDIKINLDDWSRLRLTRDR